MIASLTLWYPSPLGRWVLRPCPWGGWDLSCAHLIRPPGCPLPLLPGSASLSLPSSHPSPSDPTMKGSMKDTLAPGHSRGPCPPLLWSPHAPQGPGTARHAPAAAGPGGSAGALLPSSGCCPGMEIETPQHGEPPCVSVSLCAAALTRVSVSAHRRVCFCRVCAGCAVSRDRDLPRTCHTCWPSQVPVHLTTCSWGQVSCRGTYRAGCPLPEGSGWGTAQVSHVGVTGAQLVPQQLCSWMQGLGCTLQKRAQCVCHVLAPGTFPIFQGVHSGVIAKKIAESF